MDLAAVIISGISLLVAIMSLFFSIPAQRLQNKINRLELQLKEYELAQKEKENTKMACVEARAVTISKEKHRLKVWNSGNATAYNVSAAFEGDPHIIIMDLDKQPFDELEPGKSYELILVVYGGSDSKFKIVTRWTDSTGKMHSKTQMGDI